VGTGSDDDDAWRSWYWWRIRIFGRRGILMRYGKILRVLVLCVLRRCWVLGILLVDVGNIRGKGKVCQVTDLLKFSL